MKSADQWYRLQSSNATTSFIERIQRDAYNCGAREMRECCAKVALGWALARGNGHDVAARLRDIPVDKEEK